MRCTERDLQAGFHVIGDRAMAETVAGFETAADKLGEDAVIRARHRLEHVEMPTPEGIAALARLGVVASVQPAFDAAWGDAGELYERRLGVDRAHPMNPFGSMHRAGVVLAFGSDSPITPIDPWAGVRAAAYHHAEDERMTVARGVQRPHPRRPPRPRRRRGRGARARALRRRTPSGISATTRPARVQTLTSGSPPGRPTSAPESRPARPASRPPAADVRSDRRGRCTRPFP